MNIPESLREKMIDKLTEIIENTSLATEIEHNIYNFCIDFLKKQSCIKVTKTNIHKRMYLAKFQQVYYLLKKNSYIDYDIYSIPQNIANIAFIHYKDLCPMKWKLLEPDLDILDKKITDNDENIYTTDAFTCGNCKQNKCIYCEVQIKSCDENSTIFVRCLNCSNCFRAG